MQDQGIAGHERASVTGLGVCDVWRLELTASSGRGWPTSLRRFARRLRSCGARGRSRRSTTTPTSPSKSRLASTSFS